VRFIRKPVLALMLTVALLSRARAVARPARTRSNRPVCFGSALKGSTPRSVITDASNELVGYDVDVAKAVGEKLGVRVEFVETPWVRCSRLWRPTASTSSPTRWTINDERKASYDLSKPYSVGEGVNRDPRRRQFDQDPGRPEGQGAAENATSNWSDVARKSGARVESVEGFTHGDQAAQPGPGGRGGQRQHRGVRLSRRDRRQEPSRSPWKAGDEPSEQASPPARTADCCPT